MLFQEAGQEGAVGAGQGGRVGEEFEWGVHGLDGLQADGPEGTGSRRGAWTKGPQQGKNPFGAAARDIQNG